jgi:hypothetical protein
MKFFTPELYIRGQSKDDDVDRKGVRWTEKTAM